MEYSYDYDTYGALAAEELEEALDIMGGSMIGSGIFNGLLMLVFFIFTAIGLYTIAKRRGIDHAWMAWVPVLNSWTLGCISDQYQYLIKGKNKKRRTVLLVLGIITAVLGVTFLGSFVMMFVKVFQAILQGITDEQLIEQMAYQVVGPAMLMVLSMLPLMGVSIAYMVFHFIALHDLYKSCAPKDGAVYLVLSILINVTEPFFIFACRNKDEGMPPRRVAP